MINHFNYSMYSMANPECRVVMAIGYSVATACDLVM
jgi:hypothetical protein